MKFVLKSLVVLAVFLLSFQLHASLSTTTESDKQKDKDIDMELMKKIVTQELSMNAGKMKGILTTLNIAYEENNNVISFSIEGYPMTIIYDVNADRMRIVCPIAKLEDVSSEQITQAMEANFHSALDARYAISNGIMWAVFIHPLSDLSENLFASAIRQTLYTAATFGSEYSSGNLVFPKPVQNEQDSKPDSEVDTQK